MVNSLLKGQAHLLKCTYYSTSFRVRWEDRLLKSHKIVYKIRMMSCYTRYYSRSCCKLIIYTIKNFTHFKAHPICASSRELICVSSDSFHGLSTVKKKLYSSIRLICLIDSQSSEGLGKLLTLTWSESWNVIKRSRHRSKGQQTFPIKGQVVNALGFAGHNQSLSHIFLCFLPWFVLFLWPFKNLKAIPSSQVIQKQAVGQVCQPLE